MASSDQKNRARLEFLEWEARERPRLHAARLFGLAVLGYLYPAGLLLASLGLVAGVIAVAPLAWKSDTAVEIFYVAGLVGSLVLAAAIFRTFFVALPTPGGHPLRAGDARPLREMVEQVRRTAGGPAIHHIHLDTRLNAAVAQRRRFGMWGPRVNYLMIGLPLLIVLEPRQLRAVLAHEFAHLRGRHNSFSAWVYRIQQTWESLAAPFRTGGRLRLMTMGWFVRWYGGYFGTSTLAVRRLHEYEADARAAEACGAADAEDGRETAACALVTIEFAAHRLGRRFYPALFREAGREALPPADFLGRVSQFFGEQVEAGAVTRWRRRARGARTPITSEHPSLAERLAALGRGGFLELESGDEIAPGTAARRDPEASAVSLLGDSLGHYWKVVNAAWKAIAIDRWRYEHAAAKQAMEKAGKGTDDEAGASEAEREWGRVAPRAEYAPPEEAEAMLREFLARFGEHATANFTLGRLLLDRDEDAAAAGRFEVAMRHGSEFIAPGLNLLLEYYRDAGDDAAADPIRRRVEEHERALARARDERVRVTRRDRLTPHDLSPAQVAQITRVLNRFPQVTAAYLARKQVRLFTDKPCYVLGVVRRAHLLDDRRRADKYLIANLAAQIEVACAVVILSRTSVRLRSRLLAVCPGPVFQAKD